MFSLPNVRCYLPPDASRADAVAYRLGAVCHSIGELHQLTVEVYDVGGKLVASEKDANGSELRFDIGRQGVYIVRLWTDNGAMVRKVLVK